jgi:hypothetical protein
MALDIARRGARVHCAAEFGAKRVEEVLRRGPLVGAGAGVGVGPEGAAGHLGLPGIGASPTGEDFRAFRPILPLLALLSYSVRDALRPVRLRRPDQGIGAACQPRTGTSTSHALDPTHQRFRILY